MAFLHRVANGGGALEREYTSGSGRDGSLAHLLTAATAIELKVWPTARPTRSEGLAQLDRS